MECSSELLGESVYPPSLFHSLDLDKWINEPPPESDEDKDDDMGGWFSTEGAGGHNAHSFDHHSPSMLKKSKKEKKEDEEESKRVRVVPSWAMTSTVELLDLDLCLSVLFPLCFVK